MGLLSKATIVPMNSDMEADISFNRLIPFDSEASNFGNPFLPDSCQKAVFSQAFPNWLNGKNNRYDLRLAYLNCCPSPN
jgi:hypothetical protein